METLEGATKFGNFSLSHLEFSCRYFLVKLSFGRFRLKFHVAELSCVRYSFLGITCFFFLFCRVAE